MILVLMACLPPLLRAEHADEETDAIGQNGFVDRTHRMVSDSLLSTARWLDSFFVDERYEQEANRSRARFRLSSFTENASGTELNTHANLRLALPEMEERISFGISADPGDTAPPEDLPPRESLRNRFQKTSEGSVTAAFRYFLKTSDRLHINLDTGARIRSFEPVLYISPYYRRNFDYAPWLMRLTQRARWSTDEGWEAAGGVDMEREIWDDYFFRASTGGSWYENEHGFFYSTGLSLSRRISRGQAIEYQFNTYFQTRPTNRVEEVNLRLRYRRTIWRDWLIMEIAPQIAYPEDRDFNFTPGILIRFDVLFGYIEMEF